MTGAEIVGELLQAAAGGGPVPADRIKGGKLPDGVSLPALLIREISVTEWQPLRKGQRVRRTARVSATVRAANYRDQIAVLEWTRAVLRGWTGDHGAAERVAILIAGTGPDLIGPADSFEQAQDFRVTWDAMT